MLKLRDYNYMSWQEQVIEKYGTKALEDTINDAMIDFYITIHDKFLKGHNDQSMIDDGEPFINAALDYIYQNDEELQAE